MRCWQAMRINDWLYHKQAPWGLCWSEAHLCHRETRRLLPPDGFPLLDSSPAARAQEGMQSECLSVYPSIGNPNTLKIRGTQSQTKCECNKHFNIPKLIWKNWGINWNGMGHSPYLCHSLNTCSRVVFKSLYSSLRSSFCRHVWQTICTAASEIVSVQTRRQMVLSFQPSFSPKKCLSFS